MIKKLFWQTVLIQIRQLLLELSDPGCHCSPQISIYIRRTHAKQHYLELLGSLLFCMFGVLFPTHSPAQSILPRRRFHYFRGCYHKYDPTDRTCWFQLARRKSLMASGCLHLKEGKKSTAGVINLLFSNPSLLYVKTLTLSECVNTLWIL